MGTFDTHGGYFAPKDYVKINEGGSHEENPNGGVQIGVDPEGTPNLVEEGESIYKDYVFSDNITASEKFLDENTLPTKYAGKLYSEIADAFVDEAEESPLDPITRNGLDTFLTRLASAQEAQKAYSEQKKLERELKKLSPDELAALEQMLAQEEQTVPESQVAPEQVAPETIAPEQVAPEQVAMPQQSVMRNGGRLFETGGPTKLQTLLQSPAMVQAMTGNASTYATSGNQIPRVESTVGDELGYLGNIATYPLQASTPILSGVATAGELASSAANNNPEQANLAALTAVIVEDGKTKLSVDAGGRFHDASGKIISKEAAEVLKSEHKAWELTNKGKDLNAAVEAASAKGPLAKAWGAVKKVDPLYYYHPKTKAGKIVKGAGQVAEAGLLMRGIDKVVDTASDIKNSREGSVATVRPQFALGGNLYKWGDILNRDPKYRKDPAQQQGGYAVYPEPTSFGTVGNSDANYIWGDGYMWNGTAFPTSSDLDIAVESGGLVDYPQLPARRTGGTASPAATVVPATPVATPSIPRGVVYARTYAGLPTARAVANTPVTGLIGTRPSTSAPVIAATPAVQPTDVEAQSGRAVLPTWSRYAGVIGSGLLGLYNAFQEPDRYTAERIIPFTPSGRISLQDQVYNPVDQNMILNQALAQGNSTVRALRNSGIGPSSQAAIIAQDNNLTGNIGNTLLQTWDANNQRRNQVIAANNQNEAQRAQFDFAVDQARQNALARAQMYNAQNDLTIQRLNNAAEAEKYAALSNQIDQSLQALSDIGRENFAYNQANSNTALEGYGASRTGWGMYGYPMAYPYVLAQQPVPVEQEEKRSRGGKIGFMKKYKG